MKSCTRNSRHIDICYFFVKGKVDSNNMSIAYCSTEHMLEFVYQISTWSTICEVP